MSTFKVSLERLAKVRAHPNADRLEIAEVEGMSFQFVVLKGKHSVGDQVLYFPVDALLPAQVLRALGLEGKLAGRDNNRVKTIKLRGEISQGLVEFPEKILGASWTEVAKDTITTHLGVTKYDPPPVPCNAGVLKPLPDGVSVYDIEGADRFPEVLTQLLPQRCLVSEKLEGSHFSATRQSDGRVLVNQRRFTIEPIDGQEHDFWATARQQGLLQKLEDWTSVFGEGAQITIRGEFVGPKVQKNIYKLKQLGIYVFDILVDGHYVGAEQFLELTEGMLRAPVLSSEQTLEQWLDGRSVQAASNGQSQLHSTKREGIVVKPWHESQVSGFGRLILKQRSPEYLAKSDF